MTFLLPGFQTTINNTTPIWLHERNTNTKLEHTGALKCPDPGFKFATAHRAFAKPSGLARSMSFPSIRMSKGIASRPSLEKGLGNKVFSVGCYGKEFRQWGSHVPLILVDWINLHRMGGDNCLWMQDLNFLIGGTEWMPTKSHWFHLLSPTSRRQTALRDHRAL